MDTQKDALKRSVILPELGDEKDDAYDEQEQHEKEEEPINWEGIRNVIAGMLC